MDAIRGKLKLNKGRISQMENVDESFGTSYYLYKFVKDSISFCRSLEYVHYKVK